MPVSHKDLHFILMHGTSRIILRNKNILFLIFHFYESKPFIMANESSFHNSSVFFRKMMFLAIFFSAVSFTAVSVLLLGFKTVFLFSSFFMSAGSFAVSAFVVYFSFSLGTKLIQHLKKFFFFTFIQPEQRTDLTQAHRLVQRISQQLHHEFFSFFKFF